MTVLDRMQLPEHIERNLTDKQRGAYIMLQTIACCFVTIYGDANLPPSVLENALVLLASMKDEFLMMEELK